jgi:hypothetical protein
MTHLHDQIDGSDVSFIPECRSPPPGIVKGLVHELLGLVGVQLAGGDWALCVVASGGLLARITSTVQYERLDEHSR